MHFLALSSHPAAGAAGIASRVQLPAAGGVALFDPQLASGRPLPAPTAERAVPRGNLPLYRAQHRAQCRAACLSKANF